jgi:hypothetical protein
MYLATAAVLRQRFRCATYFGKRLGGYDRMPSIITCQTLGCLVPVVAAVGCSTGNDEIIMESPQDPKTSESMGRESSGCPKQILPIIHVQWYCSRGRHWTVVSGRTGRKMLCTQYFLGWRDRGNGDIFMPQCPLNKQPRDTEL